MLDTVLGSITGATHQYLQVGSSVCQFAASWPAFSAHLMDPPPPKADKAVLGIPGTCRLRDTKDKEFVALFNFIVISKIPTYV